MADLENDLSPSDLGDLGDLSDLKTLRYSNAVMRKHGRKMIRPKRAIYLYDPFERTFYQMTKIFPSTWSYDGATTLLEEVRSQNPTHYVVAPMYATDLIDKSMLSRSNRSTDRKGKRVSMSENTVAKLDSGLDGGACNAGDIQALIGGKAKIGETEIDGVIREVKEEGGLVFDEKDVVEHSRVRGRGRKISFSYRASIEDATVPLDENNESKGTDIQRAEGKSEADDDHNRRVCISIHGTLDAVITKLSLMQKVKLGDDIIGLAILPIEVAIQIDKCSIQYRNSNKSRR